MAKTYFPDDARIMELARPAMAGDEEALRELRAIYDRGQFDPGFGRELDALLHPPVANTLPEPVE